MKLVAFLPWEGDPKLVNDAPKKQTPCDEFDYRAVSAKLAVENHGKAVHVVMEEHLSRDSSVRDVVWDTICQVAPSTQPTPASGSTEPEPTDYDGPA